MLVLHTKRGKKLFYLGIGKGLADICTMNELHPERKEQDGCCDPDVIRTTVGVAVACIAQGLMSEEQALKYFNLKKDVFEHYKAERAKG